MSIELLLADPVNYTMLKMSITSKTLVMLWILTTLTLQSLVDNDVVRWWWDHVVSVTGMRLRLGKSPWLQWEAVNGHGQCSGTG